MLNYNGQLVFVYWGTFFLWKEGLLVSPEGLRSLELISYFGLLCNCYLVSCIDFGYIKHNKWSSYLAYIIFFLPKLSNAICHWYGNYFILWRKYVWFSQKNSITSSNYFVSKFSYIWLPPHPLDGWIVIILVKLFWSLLWETRWLWIPRIFYHIERNPVESSNVTS